MTEKFDQDKAGVTSKLQYVVQSDYKASLLSETWSSCPERCVPSSPPDKFLLAQFTYLHILLIQIDRVSSLMAPGHLCNPKLACLE